ncbi:hypothetical protein ACSLO8_25540, partial [Escherichia coli]
GSLRLTSLNLALRGLTGQMTYLHLFNFPSLIGMNTHNHFVRVTLTGTRTSAMGLPMDLAVPVA